MASVPNIEEKQMSKRIRNKRRVIFLAKKKNPCGTSKEICPKCDGCKSLPKSYKPPRPKLTTTCCHCGRTLKELKRLHIGLEEMKDVVGGDDWNWWCDDCLIKMVGQECEICHDIFTYGGIRCPKCNTNLCLTCAKGHNCGIINRIRKFLGKLVDKLPSISTGRF